jgi:CHAD domain-containing protein
MPPRIDRVSRLFDKVIRQLGKMGSHAQPKDVHQFRTAARRMEAVLEVLVPQPDRNQRKLLKQLSKARRRAGRVRDLDVQLAALRSLKASERPYVKTQALHDLSEMRAKRNDKLLESLDKAAVRDLRRRLRRAQASFTDSVPATAPAIARMLSQFANQSNPGNENGLHQYRIDGKKLRYIAELDETPEAERIVEELKRMQDAIGEWHDWLTLNSTLLKLLPDRENSPLLSAVRNISRAKYRDALQAASNARAALVRNPAAEIKAAPRPALSSESSVAAVA